MTPASSETVAFVVRQVVVLVLVVAAVALVVRAAPPAVPTPGAAGAADAEPRPPAPREQTPAGAVEAFLEAARAGDWERAASWLELPAGFPEERAAELARELKIVLDQKVWLEPETLSETVEGALDDALPADLERVGTIETERGPVEVLLERGSGPGGEPRWRFAAGTVSKVPELWEAYGHGELADWLPEPFFTLRWLRVALWQWVGLVVIALAAALLSWVLIGVIRRLLRPIVRRTRTRLDDEILQAIAAPARWAAALGSFAIGVLALRLALPVREALLTLVGILGIGVGAWMLMRGVDVAASLTQERLEREGRRSVVAVVPLGRRVLKVFLIALALIFGLQNLGLNVTGLIAGLGVGGLAVALAAQKTLENFFGGVSLISDRPVRVGDFCRFTDDRVGTIEEIGLRSTRVRTLDRTVVTIPNSDFSQRPLENFTLRDRIWLRAILNLRYETTPDQLRWVLAEMRRVLLSHPKINPDPARVRFIAFGAHSLDIEVFAYAETSDFNEFLAIREDVWLRFMDLVAASGTGFAFPSQTLYLGRDGGVDGERQGEAERRVKEWRSRGELPFPNFSPQAAKSLEDSIDYPPEGSMDRTDS